MSRKLAILWLSLMLLISINQSAEGRFQTPLGKNFKVKMGQEVSLEGTGLRMRLVSVSEDSRCPTGVTCVWRGNAKVVLEVSVGGTKPEQIALNTLFIREADGDEKALNQNEKAARAGHPFKAIYAGFIIRLVELNPYPAIDKPIKQAEYEATMAVVKSVQPKAAAFQEHSRQRGLRSYPQNGDELIAFVETFSQVDFSIADAIRHFGTVNPDNHDDEFYGNDWTILLTPFPSAQRQIKRVVLTTYDDKKKMDGVTIFYLKPILISFGKLRKWYGTPGYLPGPKCATCPRQVGYTFNYIPQGEASEKRFQVLINLKMDWRMDRRKLRFNHTDKDFIEVKEMRILRVIE